MNQRNFQTYKLSKEIIAALNGLNYNIPTKVQEEVIPLLLENKDLLVKSQTGSGKTASYGIPICELVDWLENKPQALILTPTRELAIQVKEEIKNIGRFKRIKCTTLYGGQPISIQKTELKQKTHIVVGTPGRLTDHIERGSLVLDKITYLVIDEADEMLKMGFIKQVENIIKKLPKDRVTMLFSATLPKAIKDLSLHYMHNPIDIEIKESGLTVDKIDHYFYKINENKKFNLLKNLTIIENPDSCIIFCKTKDQVDSLCNGLRSLNYSCDKIHGGMEQDNRLNTMNHFRRGEFRYLIATDVAARGIDIENITLIINYDVPLEKESYVHRTGRTGRAGLDGKAITFVTPHESRYWDNIQDFVGFKIPALSSPFEEEVLKAKSAFDQKLNAAPQIKKSKSEQLDKEIKNLFFNGGKKKKLRAVDFVGTISKIEGMTPEDIGIITIQDTITYVEILNGKGSKVLKAMKNTPVKGKQLKVYVANKK
jgi:ATP-dependent RNA helicase DeaD